MVRVGEGEGKGKGGDCIPIEVYYWGDDIAIIPLDCS